MPREVLYLDVRSPAEFAERSIKDSKNIPLDVLGLRLCELGDPARPIVVFCRSGRRSAIAAALLREAGFSHVDDAGSLDGLEAI